MNRPEIPNPQTDEFKCKEELYALFYELTSEIKGKEIEMDEEDYYNNIRTIDMSQLINYLRETIHLFIQKTIANDTPAAQLSKQCPQSTDLLDQYETIIKHYEQNERNHLRRYYMLKLNGEALENKVEEFIDMEEEFEEMKTKYKYESGKFLQNDRKDNEIIILRAENTNLKNVVNGLEEKCKGKDKELGDKMKEIEQLKGSIADLSKKLEKSVKDLGVMSQLQSQININISNTANNNNNHQSLGLPQASNSNINNNGFKCSLCGSNSTIINNSSNHSPNKSFEHTQLKLFNLKKTKMQQAKKSSKINYDLSSFNNSLNCEALTGKLSTGGCNSSVAAGGAAVSLQKKKSAVVNCNSINTSSKSQHKHNNSMNSILEKSKELFLNKYLKSHRTNNSNCTKITRMPQTNQTQMQWSIINHSNPMTKRDQSATARMLLNKKPSHSNNNNNNSNGNKSFINNSLK